MPSKTTVNWLLNAIWDCFAIGCFDEKFVTVYCILKFFSLLPKFVSFTKSKITALVVNFVYANLTANYLLC